MKSEIGFSVKFKCAHEIRVNRVQSTNVYVSKNVFYEIYKCQLCRTFIEAGRLFAITFVLEILISDFRPHPRKDIVRMSHNKIRLFGLSKVSAFIIHVVHLGFLVR